MSLAEKYGLEEADAAKHLGKSRWVLQQWRRRGIGPKYARIPGVRYSIEDIDDWIRSRIVDPAKKADEAKARGWRTRRGSR